MIGQTVMAEADECCWYSDNEYQRRRQRRLADPRWRPIVMSQARMQ